jgi:hypothetical protein
VHDGTSGKGGQARLAGRAYLCHDDCLNNSADYDVHGCILHTGRYQRQVGQARLLGEAYNYRLLPSRVVLDTLHLFLAAGHADPEQAAGCDPPSSYFRIRCDPRTDAGKIWQLSHRRFMNEPMPQYCIESCLDGDSCIAISPCISA